MPNASHFRRASTPPAMANKLLFPSGLIAIAIALSACGIADGKKAASQVAAKVNGGERIIDQELLVHRAIKAKLDRDSQVMQAIEAAKRQILARAYIDRAVTAASSETGSQEEMRKF